MVRCALLETIIRQFPIWRLRDYFKVYISSANIAYWIRYIIDRRNQTVKFELFNVLTHDYYNRRRTNFSWFSQISFYSLSFSVCVSIWFSMIDLSDLIEQSSSHYDFDVNSEIEQKRKKPKTTTWIAGRQTRIRSEGMIAPLLPTGPGEPSCQSKLNRNYGPQNSLRRSPRRFNAQGDFNTDESDDAESEDDNNRKKKE